MKYTYPAIIERDENNNNLFNITFPDIQGCFTCSSSEEQIMQDAKEVLKLHLNSKTKRITPSPVESLQDKNKFAKIILVEVFINE